MPPAYGENIEASAASIDIATGLTGSAIVGLRLAARVTHLCVEQ